jgi:hypothetical protein
MGVMQRRKGKRGERATATEIREALPELAARVRRGWQARDGADAADVIAPGLPYWIEVKSGRKPNPRAALEQAREAVRKARSDDVPVAVIRDDRSTPFAVLPWDALLRLLVLEYRTAGTTSASHEIVVGGVSTAAADASMKPKP